MPAYVIRLTVSDEVPRSSIGGPAVRKVYLRHDGRGWQIGRLDPDRLRVRPNGKDKATQLGSYQEAKQALERYAGISTWYKVGWLVNPEIVQVAA